MYILLASFITIYKTIVIFLQQLWNKHCVHLCFIKFFASKVASIFSFRIWFYFRCILLYLFRCHDFLAFSLFIDVVFFYGFFVTFICNIYTKERGSKSLIPQPIQSNETWIPELIVFQYEVKNI